MNKSTAFLLAISLSFMLVGAGCSTRPPDIQMISASQTYKNDVYSFQYPREYIITEAGKTNTHILSVGKNEKTKIEIFDAKNYPSERETIGLGPNPTAEDEATNKRLIDNFSKKKLVLSNSGLEVWFYYGTGDTGSEKELQAIFDSIVLKNVGPIETATNNFKLSDLKVGLEVAGLKVKSFGPSYTTEPMSVNNLTVYFEGTKTVSGIYSGKMVSGMSVPFFDLDEASVKIMPRLNSENIESKRFYFKPPVADMVAKSKLGAVKKTATIVIENFTLDIFTSTHFTNNADLVEVKETALPNSTSTSAAPDDDTVIANLKYAIGKSKQTDQIFMDPEIDRVNEMRFYYVTNASVITPADMPTNDGSGIYVYDITKDTAYQKDGTFNINEGSSELFYQMLHRSRLLRGVGIIEKKFVFVEQDIDTFPRMCGSAWLYHDLNYIDLGVAKATKKPFTISEDLKKHEQNKVDACQKSI